MADPADEKEQQRVESEIDAATIAFEISLLAIIAERLGSIEGLTYAEIYALMNEDIARIKSTVRSGIKGLQNTVSRIMDEMASMNDKWAERFYKARGKAQESAFNNMLLSETLEREKKAAIESLSVYCRSSVVSIGDKTFVPIEEAYRQTVTKAATAMQAGSETLQQVVRSSVQSMSKDGLRVQYQSGVTRNLHTAVRTNVMDAYRTAMTELREIQGREFGADGVEVSAHALCAPDHQPYQGQQYSNAEWRDIQHQPARPLVTGANCGHTVFPVILGISSKAYSREELQKLNDLSNQEVEFEGLSGNKLTMSRYEASQYQRKLETTIRKQKENEYLLKQANLPNFAKMERETIKHYESEYKRISEKAGLTPRMELTRIFLQK